MPDCDYCSESFDGEAAYLDHLEATHADEVGAVDQRRLDNRRADDSGLRLGLFAVGIIAVLAVGGGIYAVAGGGSAVEPDGIETTSLDQQGDADRLAAVETFESQGRRHVASDTNIDYAQTPPLSGPHYDRPAEAGYYQSTQPAGALVHALEHGAVVIYYAPAASSNATGTTDTPTESLEEFAATHSDRWASVIVVPNPRETPRAEYVLTAWRHRLTMDTYNAETVKSFLSEYLGRGPEHPVR